MSDPNVRRSSSENQSPSEDTFTNQSIYDQSQVDQPDSPSRSKQSRQRSLHRVGRRSFLGHASLFTTAGVVAGVVGSPFSTKQNAASAQTAQTAPSDSNEQFRQKTHQVRVITADTNQAVAIPPHPTNGDEERYANKIGSDTRALPHNERGEVDLQAYQSAIKAYTTGDPNDFEQIVLGGTRKQLNPIGSLAVSLTGCNATQLAVPPAPRLDSAERAAEAVELYWLSLLRDISFSELQDDTSHPDALLKALFDETFVIPDPVIPDPNDPTQVIPYTGAPLTVGGELNKLAVNYAYGRNAAGIHWRSDAAASLALGEAIAISILKDERATFRENFTGFTFTKFDGTQITV